MVESERLARTVAVIGVGSPFGNDTLGWQAIDLLEKSEVRSHFPGIQVIFSKIDRPGALLLDYLKGTDAAVVIDAMQAGLSCGDIRQFSPKQLMAGSGLLSSHGFGVAQALALGSVLAHSHDTLNVIPGRLSIIGIEMGGGEMPDPSVQAWQQQLPLMMYTLLQRWYGEVDSF